MNLSPARFFLKSTKQHIAAPQHDHAWDISILSKGPLLMNWKKISRISIQISSQITVLYHATDSSRRSSSPCCCDVSRPSPSRHHPTSPGPQVAPKTMKQRRKSKKRWDSTMSPKKANNKRHVQSMSMTEKASHCTTIPGSLSVGKIYISDSDNLSNEERVQLKSINAIPRIGAWQRKEICLRLLFLLVKLYLLGSEIFKISPKFGTRKSLNTKEIPPRSLEVTEIFRGA